MAKSSGSGKGHVVSEHVAVPCGTLVGDYNKVTVTDGKGNTASGPTKEKAFDKLDKQNKK